MNREAFVKLAQSAVVPFVVVTAERIYQVGTAFCVSPIGVWVTARHNLEGRLGATEYSETYPDSYIAILWIGPDDDHRIPIPVTSFTRHPASGSDLALLWTDAPSITFPALRLNTLVPPEGTPIMALGYPEFEYKTSNGGAEQLWPNLKITAGKVTEIYPDGRNTFIDIDGNIGGDLPTVCYETTAQSDFAMSGGPVLDHSGSVRGVIATGCDRSEPEQPDTSFISATPYIFMLKVAYDENNQVSVYELAQRGVVMTDDSFERLRMTESDNRIDLYYED